MNLKRKESRASRSVRPARAERIQLEETLVLTVCGLSRGDVRMEAEDGTTFLCAKSQSRGTLWGDRVLAARIGREHVVVERVLERAHEEIIGVLSIGRYAQLVLAPLERRLPPRIDVAGMEIEAKAGDIVRARVVRWEDEGGLLVQVEARIGCFEQATCALDALVASAHLPTDFREDVLRQADTCRPAALADDPEREDMRGITSFTIDGRDAKDFDDAVSLEPLANGHVRLGVHIADVGYYVPQGSALDDEAYARGTSVYLPGRVLPMLPEQLSNGVCSLRPHEDKFTLSALMELDETGSVVHARLARTITRSDARLVYDDVNALFAGEEMGEPLAGLRDTLLAMRACARRIRARRQAQGCIDFETNEPQFVLDASGEPVEIVLRARGEAETMIEDFMLTANEAVAHFAREHSVPLLYRIHEKPDPDKLAVFAEFLHGLGVDARGITREAKPADIRDVLERTHERPEYSVIATLALRSMQKARYDAQPLGHYGLALADYCHFTSPIRRYPDLVVSRALTAVLTGQRVPLTGDALSDAAKRSSERERTAIDAERAADKLMMARFMASHVGEVFSGTISGVNEWGVYVALENGAEGFLSVRTLSDWFAFDERQLLLRGERTGAVLALGMALDVQVDDVELTTSSVELSLAQPLRRRNARRADADGDAKKPRRIQRRSAKRESVKHESAKRRSAKRKSSGWASETDRSAAYRGMTGRGRAETQGAPMAEPPRYVQQEAPKKKPCKASKKQKKARNKQRPSLRD